VAVCIKTLGAWKAEHVCHFVDVCARYDFGILFSLAGVRMAPPIPMTMFRRHPRHRTCRRWGRMTWARPPTSRPTSRSKHQKIPNRTARLRTGLKKNPNSTTTAPWSMTSRRQVTCPRSRSTPGASAESLCRCRSWSDVRTSTCPVCSRHRSFLPAVRKTSSRPNLIIPTLRLRSAIDAPTVLPWQRR